MDTKNQTQTQTEEQPTLQQIIEAGKNLLLQKEHERKSAEMTSEWNKYLPSFKKLVSEARKALKVGDAVCYPSQEDPAVWQIRQVEKVSDLSSSGNLVVKWKPFEHIHDKEKIIWTCLCKVAENEDLTEIAIPLSVVNGDISALQAIFRLLYGEK